MRRVLRERTRIAITCSFARVDSGFPYTTSGFPLSGRRIYRRASVVIISDTRAMSPPEKCDALEGQIAELAATLGKWWPCGLN